MGLWNEIADKHFKNPNFIHKTGHTGPDWLAGPTGPDWLVPQAPTGWSHRPRLVGTQAPTGWSPRPRLVGPTGPDWLSPRPRLARLTGPDWLVTQAPTGWHTGPTGSHTGSHWLVRGCRVLAHPSLIVAGRLSPSGSWSVPFYSNRPTVHF